MPLFNYKCKDCGNVMELFVHNDDDEIVCTECESKNCEKMVSAFNNRTWLNAKENFNERISPDVDRVQKEMSQGRYKDSTFLDLYGDK